MRLQLVCVCAMAMAAGRTWGQGATEVTPAWMTAMAERHALLIAENGPGTNGVLGTKLIDMLKRDQSVRQQVGKQNAAEEAKSNADMAAMDAEITAELKAIVAKDGWPTIALVGYAASNAAMIMLIHTGDEAWQKSMLEPLQKLVVTDKIAGDAFATLVDKELVGEGKAQVYGTQFKTVGDGMVMYRVKEPAGLEARRKKAMLMPEDAYKAIMESTYHVKVMDGVAEPEKLP